MISATALTTRQFPKGITVRIRATALTLLCHIRVSVV